MPGAPSSTTRERLKWVGIFLALILGTSYWAALCVWAVRSALDEIHDHLDVIEEKIDKLERSQR
jgi:hypothetical protein